jgi:hypothetical protein
MAYVAMILFVIVILFVAGRSPLKRPRPIPTISNPVLGVLNLIGLAAETDVTADLEQLTEYFSEVRQADDVPPRCDVLLLYCNINSAGVVIGSTQRLGEIIRDAGAVVAVVATSNDGADYRAAGPLPGTANLVMTIDRRGPLLASMLAQLFAQMKNGVSMGMAWVNLAPQYEGAPEHKDLPATICAFEYGHIAFR